MLLTILIFFVVLSALVFVHELGHFLTARYFGVRAEEFGMGLPPRLFGVQKFNGRWRLVSAKYQPKEGESTVYSVNLIPVGGFVKIKGENGEEEKASDSFGSKPIWQRNLILAAGVTMNVVLCALLLAVTFMIGTPGFADQEYRGASVSGSQVKVLEILPGSSAEQAGLKIGDVVLSVDGAEISSVEELKAILSVSIDQEVVLGLERFTEKLALTVTPSANDEGKGEIGIAIAEINLVKYPWYLAIWQGIKMTWLWLLLIFSALWGLVRQLFGGASSGVDFTGPIGIAVMTGQATKMGLTYLLQFTALLSLNLAIINILPFPALDGGRILFLTIGKLRGKMIAAKWENLSHNLGFALLMLLIVFITYRDIARYGGRIISVLKGLVGL
jgi:regulator of sigma E protease